MSGFVQVVHSRVHAGSEQAMLQLRPQFVRAMRQAVPGLREARLVRLDDGTWLDIVEWESRTAADAAGAAHSQVPDAVQIAAHIDSVIAIVQGDVGPH